MQKNIFWIIMFIFFIVFISLFIASKSGYYEYENHNKKVFTEEKMKEFENDLKEGKNVDIKNYIYEDNKNYENKITKIGNFISNLLSNGILKSVKITTKVFENLFN